jgi:outer membrane receptor for ferrienterochelin and colicin
MVSKRRRAFLLLGNVLLALLIVAKAGAQPSTDTRSLPLEEPPEAENADDLDSLLELADKNIESLGRVNVSATNPLVEGVSKREETLSEAPGIVDVISARDIQQFGAKNLYEVLERATSVYMTGSFLFPRNVASIRGNLQNHEDNHVLVLINGRPFRDITLGGVNVSIYTAFPIHTIEHIEVIRGPGSVLYGTNAFNGVINIVTKDPEQPTMHASVLSGSYGWQSYSAAAGDGNERRGAYAGATYSRSQGWPFTATEDLVAPAPLDTDSAQWGEDNIGVFTMYRNGNFTANMFAARASEEMLGPSGEWPSDRLKDPRVFCDFGYLLEFDECRSLDLHFTYNFDGTYFPSVLAVPGGADFPFKTRSHSFLLEGTYYATLTDELELLVGGLVDFHMGRAYIEPLAIPTIPDFTEIWYGVYMQMEYQATDWLKLVGGMQGNLPGDIPGGIVPRAGLIASLDEHWTAKFLYGQAFRSPYQIERSINVPGILTGNPDLIPETIQTFDAQLAYATDDFRLAATWFHSDYFDVISRVGIPQTYVNEGRMKFDGVELENEWEFSERWRWLGSVTYQDNVRNDVHNTTGVPNWMAKMGLAYYNECSGWNVGLFDTFFGDPTVPATATVVNAEPEAYHLMSLNMTLDLDRRFNLRTGRSMELQFMVQNLLDEEIHHFEFERELINSLPAGPGRTFYGGFTMAY